MIAALTAWCHVNDLDVLPLLERGAQFAVARREIEGTYRRLLNAGMRADDVANSARSAVADLELIERKPLALRAFKEGGELGAARRGKNGR